MPRVDVLTASQTTPETRRALLVMIDVFQPCVVAYQDRKKNKEEEGNVKRGLV
jgi:hypothetical protein